MSLAYADQVVDLQSNAQAAAQAKLDALIQMPTSAIQAYELDPAKIQQATIGTPIPCYNLAHTYGSVTQRLIPASEWLFPVVYSNTTLTVIRVRQQKTQMNVQVRAIVWRIIKQIQTEWPPSKGYHFNLILSPNTDFYYFNIPEAGDNLTEATRLLEYGQHTLTPLTSAGISWSN